MLALNYQFIWICSNRNFLFLCLDLNGGEGALQGKFTTKFDIIFWNFDVYPKWYMIDFEMFKNFP